MTDKLDEAILAYAAGFLDGEGCFYSSKDRYCKAAVTCTNSHRPTIEWLHKIFGGQFACEKRRQKHHKQLYRWSVADNEAAKVCQILAPFLKEKAEQALLIIAIQQTKSKTNSGKAGIPLDIIEQRKWLANRLQELKHAS
jgi:hypothetical protein